MRGFFKRAAVFLLCCLFVRPVSASGRLLPVYCVARTDRKMSLSFDAAWGNEDTQTLIDTLAKYNVRVTFFVVGNWARKYPESVRALHEAGHEVMNHSNTHPHMTALSDAELKKEITECNAAIKSVTGVSPTLMRVPFGEYDNRVISAVRDQGMTCVQWDVDSLDWKDLSAKEIYDRVTSRIKPGSIVLFHNAALHTTEALEDILLWLQKNDFEPVAISELLLEGDYTIDHEGRQTPKKPA